MSRANMLLESENGAQENQQVAIAPTIQMELTAPPESGISIQYPGKLSVRTILGKLRPRVQRHLSQYSYGTPEEQSQNLVVEGDNLQIMASLYRYRGQVDLILADPPYNTGNDFRYNDRWVEDPNDPAPGELVKAEDGSKHTKWMQFMAPRLEMMKAMLKPGGVCAVCIDDRELFRLGMMMDEIFGERNRIAIINWQKAYSAKNGTEHVSTATEYVLIYAKSKDRAATALLERTGAMDARYRNYDDDPRLEWKGADLSAPPHKKREDYGIQSPFTGIIHYPPGTRRWGPRKTKIKQWLEEWGSDYTEVIDPLVSPRKSLVLKGTKLVKASQQETLLPGDEPSNEDRLVTPPDVVERARERALQRQQQRPWPELVFLSDGNGVPSLKGYLSDVKKGRIPLTYWADETYDDPIELGSQSWDHVESGHSQTGINELGAIIGSRHGFETVKPMKLFTKIIQLWCPASGIVLDPFAGSGTTGHAVLKLNHDVESSRRFILIEQSRPERGDAYARTLTAERLRRVITGEWSSGVQESLGGGFTFKTSTTQVDGRAVLAMQREELVDLVLMSHWEVRSRKGPMLTTLVHKSFKYLVAKDVAGHGYFLVWDGPDVKSLLTDSVLQEIAKEAEIEGLAPPYNVYARIAHVIDEDVVFWKIPRDILMKIGFSEVLSGAEER